MSDKIMSLIHQTHNMNFNTSQLSWAESRDTNSDGSNRIDFVGGHASEFNIHPKET